MGPPLLLFNEVIINISTLGLWLDDCEEDRRSGEQTRTLGSANTGITAKLKNLLPAILSSPIEITAYDSLSEKQYWLHTKNTG